MFKRRTVLFSEDLIKNKRNSASRLDSVVAEVARSAALTDNESDDAIASSLLFSRLRETIESEKRPIQAAESSIATPVVGNIKLAFSGVMIAAAIAFWFIRVPAISGHAAQPLPPEPPSALTACSISATSACVISTGDVLQLLLTKNVQELPK